MATKKNSAAEAVIVQTDGAAEAVIVQTDSAAETMEDQSEASCDGVTTTEIEQAKASDIECEAQRIMASHYKENVYKVGALWFSEKQFAEAESKRSGNEILTYNKK